MVCFGTPLRGWMDCGGGVVTVGVVGVVLANPNPNKHESLEGRAHLTRPQGNDHCPIMARHF